VGGEIWTALRDGHVVLLIDQSLSQPESQARSQPYSHQIPAIWNDLDVVSML
jgi:hypothetical protein